MTQTIIGFVALFVLVFAGVPLGIAMALVGVVGFGLQQAWPPALEMVGQISIDTVVDYNFAILPLFILMGNFVARAGAAESLYKAADAIIGHLRGGLSMATIVACAGFSAICGSSVATAATMAKIAIPEMRRFGYAERLAVGSVAAGGTLGTLIPPSVVLVLYGFMTDSNIGQLFIASLLPALLGLFGYLLTVFVVTRLSAQAGPPSGKKPWPERWVAVRGASGMGLLFLVVIGGIYGGVFTPAEAAGIGAGGAFLLALASGRLTVSAFVEVLKESSSTTASLFLILIGALLFGNFLNVSGAPAALVAYIKGLNADPLMVILAIVVIYLILGCVLESLAMILLTVPMFYPVVQAVGYDIIWFGILVAVVVEISLITPPVGLNVFVIKALLPETRTGLIYHGIVPFLISDIVRLAIVVLFPPLSLVLLR